MNKNVLTADQVRRIAQLAKLPLEAASVNVLAAQLTSILDLVNKLHEVDTTSVPVTSQVTGLVNVFREDEITPSLTQKQALANAKRTHKGFFVVPAIFE